MLRYLFRNKLNFILSLFLSILGYGSLLLLFLSYSMITNVIQNNDWNGAYQVTFLVLTLITSLLFFSVMSVKVTRKILKDAVGQLRNDVFNAAYNKSIYDYLKKGANYHSSLLINDVDIVEDKYFRPIIEIINDAIQIIIMCVAIAFVGLKYLIIIILLSILVVIAPFIFKKSLNEKGNVLSIKLEKFTSITKETISAFSVSKYFRKQSAVLSRLGKDIDALENSRFQLNLIRAYNFTLSIVVVMLLKIISLYSFTVFALNGVLNVATIALLFSLTNNIGNPLNNILNYIENINSTRGIRKNLLITCENSHINVIEYEMLESKNEDLIAQNVILQCDGKIILNNFSYIFEKGKKYAIVGESGSGKSSFCRLLMGYFENYDGKIEIFGKELEKIPKNLLYQKVGYVSQDLLIISDTLRNNITLLSNQFSDEAILEAMEKAGLNYLVEKLPNGLNSTIEAGNNSLSGGERQRIALARAFLYDSHIYIFDEATAALDNIAAQGIEKHILELKDKIVISIVHKMNETIHQFDEIIVMKDGSIKSFGSFTEIFHENRDIFGLIDCKGV